MSMRGRPVGSMGSVAVALQDAARSGGPGSYADLAARACVGLKTARYTVPRMVQRGELVVLDGGVRPAVLAAPGALAIPPGGDSLGVVLDELHAAFWAGKAAAPRAALSDADLEGIVSG